MYKRNTTFIYKYTRTSKLEADMAKKQKQKQVQEPEVTGTTEAEYQDLPESIVDALMRPEPVVDKVNKEINDEYPWVVSSITTTQRAILCELVRIRKALEAK